MDLRLVYHDLCAIANSRFNPDCGRDGGAEQLECLADDLAEFGLLLLGRVLTAPGLHHVLPTVASVAVVGRKLSIALAE